MPNETMVLVCGFLRHGQRSRSSPSINNTKTRYRCSRQILITCLLWFKHLPASSAHKSTGIWWVLILDVHPWKKAYNERAMPGFYFMNQ